MRRLRKQYLAESLVDLRAKEAEAEKQKEARAVARERLREEVRRFKEEMMQKNSSLGPGGKGATSGRPALDEALGAAKVGETETVAKKNLSPLDPKSLEEPDGWHKYATARRRTRFKTELERKQRLAKARIASLMYLLHASADFVTYRNLEDKLQDVFLRTFSQMHVAVSHSELVDQIKKLEEDALRAPHPALIMSSLAEADAALSKAQGGDSKSLPSISPPVTGEVAEELLMRQQNIRIAPKIHGNRRQSSITNSFDRDQRPPDLRPASSGEETARSRRMALRDALEGTVAMRPGQEAVKRYLKNHGLDKDVLPHEREGTSQADDDFADELLPKVEPVKDFRRGDSLLDSVIGGFKKKVDE
ncbi:hypothetical protein HDU67_005221 [Dinochytrium kinnereticum]|nr:hypothetical protein HDU67_005221 [Dinochytrium kinnereticum]